MRAKNAFTSGASASGAHSASGGFSRFLLAVVTIAAFRSFASNAAAGARKDLPRNKRIKIARRTQR